MDPPRYELLQSHERGWGETRRVGVIAGCGVFGPPFVEE